MKRLNSKSEPMPSLVDLYKRQRLHESSSEIPSGGSNNVELILNLTNPSRHHLLESLTFKRLDLNDDFFSSEVRRAIRKQKEFILPDNLTVQGNLSVESKKLKQLPDNLKVGGTLYVVNSKLKDVPKNLQIGKYFYINNTPLALWRSPKKIHELVEKRGGSIGGYVYKSNSAIFNGPYKK